MSDLQDHSKGVRKQAPLKLARTLVAAALAAVLIGAIVSIQLPLLVIQPGPTRDVAELVAIDAPTHRSRGSFILATALIKATGGVNVPTALRTLVDAEKDLIAKQSIFPSGTSRTHTDQLHSAQMSESQEEGAVAALAELGMRSRPDGAFVREASGEAPAAAVLRPGDVITRVDGKAVPRLRDLLRVIESRRAGSTVRLTVRRADSEKLLRVKTIKDDRTGRTRIGVDVIQKRKLPIRISATAADIGGPSAGLMFALSIYDSLTAGDLTGGKKISGTGTISNPGNRTGIVGPVGAITQKIKGAEAAGAKVFLVPQKEAAAAKRAAGPATRVLPISTLREAIGRLKDSQKG